ncbi:MAG TPA: hypothetical protein VNQ14_14580, partial [Woeseiaceae bacterium]|nr:hypothetical protein [Woeseiaceae bacterium]
VMYEYPERDDGIPSGNFIVNAGAVMAVLLAIPSLFIGLFGFAGVITGQKLVAGGLGAAWGYMAVVGTYELNRRKFNWERGSKHRDQHLLAGSLAVCIGLAVGGAVHETMPALAIVPALSAIKQANDGHDWKILSVIHAILLLAGIGAAMWLYSNKVTGLVILERIAAMP